MRVAVAQPRRQRHRAFDVETHVAVFGKTNRAVHLDRLARNQQRGIGAARLDAAGGGGARFGLGFAVEHGNTIREHRAGEFLLNVQIHRAVLQRLKAADGFAELHARFEVFERYFQRAHHDAAQFRAGDGGGVIDGACQRRRRRCAGVDDVFFCHADVRQIQRARLPAIGQRIERQRRARRIARHPQQLHALCRRF